MPGSCLAKHTSLLVHLCSCLHLWNVTNKFTYSSDQKYCMFRSWRITYCPPGISSRPWPCWSWWASSTPAPRWCPRTWGGPPRPQTPSLSLPSEPAGTPVVNWNLFGRKSKDTKGVNVIRNRASFNNNCKNNSALNYRVTHHVYSSLPLTSKHKFRFGLTRAGLKSTGGLNQRDVSPCSLYTS